MRIGPSCGPRATRGRRCNRFRSCRLLATRRRWQHGRPAGDWRRGGMRVAAPEALQIRPLKGRGTAYGRGAPSEERANLALQYGSPNSGAPAAPPVTADPAATRTDAHDAGSHAQAPTGSVTWAAADRMPLRAAISGTPWSAPRAPDDGDGPGSHQNTEVAIARQTARTTEAARTAPDQARRITLAASQTQRARQHQRVQAGPTSVAISDPKAQPRPPRAARGAKPRSRPSRPARCGLRRRSRTPTPAGARGA